MGSAGYRITQGRESALSDIAGGEYHILVALVRRDPETNRRKRCAYKLFPEFDEAEIREYAAKIAKDNPELRLIRIEIFSLESRLTQKIGL